MTKKILSLVLASVLVAQVPVTLRAGGFLEQIDITGNLPSPIAGHVVGRLVPIRWDVRALPVRYSMNSTQDPIPNPLGASFLSLAEATAVMQASLDAWNDIPTSYIRMDVANTVANPGTRGFDMVNEITFRTAAGFTAIASSPSTSLIADTQFTNGLDIDGDGDPDVSDAISAAADVDNDGDIEFPAGLYKAGTILDNDVQFNVKAANGFRFTVDPAAADAVTRSVDLMAVAVHEFGHSIGLSHTLDNQTSDSDGNGTTMYPFIDTGDPASELSQRTLGSDDIAWASYHYPEGTAASGPAALQAGDVAFGAVYGLIDGEVRHGVLAQPIAGASVAAYDWRTGAFVAAGFSGTVQVSVSPTGGLFIVDPAFNIANGKYLIPVPKGSYAVGVEAMDGSPVAAANVSLSGQIGGIFGQLNFDEEFYNVNKEAQAEFRPGQRTNVPVQPGRVRSGVDITTNRNININNFGNRNFIGFTGQAGSSYYAVRVPASQVAAAVTVAKTNVSLHSMLFETFLSDASTLPRFAEAMLTTGTVSGTTATLDLANPLDRVSGFLGQDGDFAPFYLKNGHTLAKKILAGHANGTITDLFMVLRLPQGPFPGVSGVPPLIGLDGGVAVNDVPIFGYSYTSPDGQTFTRVNNFNFRFSLGLAQVP